MEKIFTSESVNVGHPDKTCDVIADAFLDEALKQDKFAQMAVECAIKNNKLFVYGEATTTAKIDYEKIAKDVLDEIGYNSNEFEVICEVSEQSPDINQAVVKSDLKAGDQGMVFGYATNETKEFMPMPIMVAHKLMRQYEQFRKHHAGKFFADAKSEVSVLYGDDGKPKKIVTIVLSASHSEDVTQSEIEFEIKKNVVQVVLHEYKDFIFDDLKILINTSGRFTIWGSFGDSGCVGRKIIVDTYGGMGRVGGGCFSSKNATKVDRSAAYYARFVAKNVVANGLADRCEIQASYAIGLAEPISLFVDTFGTNKVPELEIEKIIKNNFNFNVNNIVSELNLFEPVFKQTACFGHFGRNEFAWEKIKNLK